MNRPITPRHAFIVSMAIALLAGCGGSQPLIGAPRAMLSAKSAQAGNPLNGARSGDLLYVSENSQGAVEVFTYPSGRLVQTLSVLAPWGLCSDSNGNVFIP